MAAATAAVQAYGWTEEDQGRFNDIEDRLDAERMESEAGIAAYRARHGSGLP